MLELKIYINFGFDLSKVMHKIEIDRRKKGIKLNKWWNLIRNSKNEHLPNINIHIMRNTYMQGMMQLQNGPLRITTVPGVCTSSHEPSGCSVWGNFIPTSLNECSCGAHHKRHKLEFQFFINPVWRDWRHILFGHCHIEPILTYTYVCVYVY